MINIKKLTPIIFGFLLWIIGPPIGLTPNAYYTFVIFLSVILSLLIRAIPLAVSVLSGLSISILLNILTLKDALKGYADSTTWLVVIAFLISGIIIHTGLGKRISLICIHRFGKSITGLGYGICAAEFILGPLVPSNTARGGGILAPIVNSISQSLGSTPLKSPEKAGQYLHLVGAHANLITAAMFLTGMAANPLISKAAMDIFQIEFDWVTWALGSIIPGIIGLALLPLLIHFFSKTTIQSIKSVHQKIQNEIQQLGAWSRNEITTAIILSLMLMLWITKEIHGLGTTTVALFGLVALLILKAISWDQIVKNHRAWDTLIWLGGLLTLANSLKDLGFISWLSENLQQSFSDLTPVLLLIILAIIYFYSMYFFSMLTAHIIALSSAVFLVLSGTNINPFIIVGITAYFSNLCGCLTNYSTGPVIIYFGNGYVQPSSWFKIGFIVSIFHIIIWLGIGSIWWKIIGWW